ncbi:MAG TPA: methylmalonyl-CoA mutase family protein, partial [Thermoanaerobaculia bacterium]|nr:methylmalonyl-CoA mutase family protein [Thermoanaerobaculia bacterium]
MSPAETAAPQFPPVSYADWRARVESELGDDAPRRLRRESLEGLVVEPLYSSDHLPAGVPLPRFARVPGPWRIWQELPIGAGAAGQAALARERSRDLGGIWLRATDEAADAAALATLLGSVLAGGGVEVVLEHAGEPLAGAALLVAGAQAAGTAPDRLAGCLGCDPLGALARRGRLSGSASEQLVAAARWALDQAPGLRAGLVSTAPYADAGADSTQEIAYALATGAEALRPLLAAGLTAETAASQLLVSITVGRDLYLQVAKLRALRLTWGMLLASLDAPP